MKKIVAVTILAMLCILSGCCNSTSRTKQPDASMRENSRDQTVQAGGSMKAVPVEKSWTVEEIQSLFIKANQKLVR